MEAAAAPTTTNWDGRRFGKLIPTCSSGIWERTLKNPIFEPRMLACLLL